jgi:hypothetical protein
MNQRVSETQSPTVHERETSHVKESGGQALEALDAYPGGFRSEFDKPADTTGVVVLAQSGSPDN